MFYKEGNYYLIFNRGCNKENIFYTDSDYKLLISKMIGLKQKGEVPVLKWLQTLFNGYVQRINSRYNRIGTLFKRSAKKRLIKDLEYLIEVIHYIHFNPERNNLVDDAAEWKYSSLRHYLRIESNTFISDSFVENQFHENNKYEDQFNEYKKKYYLNSQP